MADLTPDGLDPAEVYAWERSLANRADVRESAITAEGYVLVTYAGAREVLPLGWMRDAQGGSTAVRPHVGGAR